MTLLQTLPKLSSEAKKFLNTDFAEIRPKLVEQYNYLGAGANLPKLPEVNSEDKIHKFLSQCAGTEEVYKEFGKNLNITV